MCCCCCRHRCCCQVIYHGRESVSTVANEVQLMLNLNHPNIVRAYHCITKQLVAAQQQPTTITLSPQLSATVSQGGSDIFVVRDVTQYGSAVPSRVGTPPISGAGTPQQPVLPLLSLHRQQQRESSMDVAPLPDRGFAVIHTGHGGSREPQQQQMQTQTQAAAVGEVELVAPLVGSAFHTTGSVMSPMQPSTPPNLPGAAASMRLALGQTRARDRWCVGE